MVDFTNIRWHEGGIALHRVGNKYRAEKNVITSQLYQPDSTLLEALQHYFTKPFKKEGLPSYRFHHEGGLAYHPLYNLAKEVFEHPERLLANSQAIVEHLYRQSDHPNIKPGEVYLVLWHDVIYDDEMVDCIGIFKSELRSPFFMVDDYSGRLEINHLEGIYAEKLDKGTLIMGTFEEEGYRVVSIDNNRYDADYWLYQFQHVEQVKDDAFYTQSYLQLCSDFAEQVVGSGGEEMEHLNFVSDSVAYFNANERFDLEEFSTAVLQDRPDWATAFDDFRDRRELNQVRDFGIPARAVKQAQKFLPTTIKLDNNIQIKLDFNNPDASRHFLVKGYDEEKGMSYYKVYFREELS